MICAVAVAEVSDTEPPLGAKVTVRVAVPVVEFFVQVGNVPNAEYPVPVVVVQQAVNVILPLGVKAVPAAYEVVPFHHLLKV